MKLPNLLTENRDNKRINKDTKKLITRLAEDTLSDKEYNEMMRRTRGGRDCDGCDD